MTLSQQRAICSLETTKTTFRETLRAVTKPPNQNRDTKGQKPIQPLFVPHQAELVLLQSRSVCELLWGQLFIKAPFPLYSWRAIIIQQSIFGLPLSVLEAPVKQAILQAEQQVSQLWLRENQSRHVWMLEAFQEKKKNTVGYCEEHSWVLGTQDLFCTEIANQKPAHLSDIHGWICQLNFGLITIHLSHQYISLVCLCYAVHCTPSILRWCLLHLNEELCLI